MERPSDNDEMEAEKDKKLCHRLHSSLLHLKIVEVQEGEQSD